MAWRMYALYRVPSSSECIPQVQPAKLAQGFKLYFLTATNTYKLLSRSKFKVKYYNLSILM